MGTTYSCVGVWKDGGVEIIPNADGERTTPSVVAFADGERLIGASAKSQAARNYKNTIYDAKRMIGRKYADAPLRKDMESWPFKVIADKDGKPMVVVEQNGKETQLRAGKAEMAMALLSGARMHVTPTM